MSGIQEGNSVLVASEYDRLNVHFVGDIELTPWISKEDEIRVKTTPENLQLLIENLSGFRLEEVDPFPRFWKEYRVVSNENRNVCEVVFLERRGASFCICFEDKSVEPIANVVITPFYLEELLGEVMGGFSREKNPEEDFWAKYRFF